MSKFCGDSGVNQAERVMGGCFKCFSRCDLCKNFSIQDSKFKSSSTILFTWPRVKMQFYST